MRRLLLRRPSPALIVSFIALLVAMGGTTYAAFKLPKNSVGTKQVKKNAITTAKIKKNAVTGAKVKNQTLTGSDIQVATLGKVPAATLADTANAVAPPEAVHLVGAPGEPPFLGGSKNVPEAEGLKLAPISFYKDRGGFVHLEGLAQAGEEAIFSSYVPIFALPPGYRPASGVTQLFPGVTGTPILVFGSSTNLEGKSVDGIVAGPKTEAVSLTGIVFMPGS